MKTATTAHARRTDPETSHAAAASVADLRTSQKAVLRVLRSRPSAGFTDEELVFHYQAKRVSVDHPRQSESGIRTRRAELVAAGLVEHRDTKRLLRSLRWARVWHAVR